MPFTPDTVYVSEWNQKKLIWYVKNKNGSLVRTGEADVKGNPGALAIDPGHNFLYAALRDICSVAVFKINRADGSLLYKDTIPVAGNPAHLYVEKNGRHLLCSYFADNRISLHKINSDGIIDSAPVQQFDYPEKTSPHFMKQDHSGQYVILPCMHGDAIRVFKISQETGLLEKNNPEKIVTTPETGPRHFEFHPGKDVMFCVNEKINTVVEYAFDRQSGTLTPLRSIPTIPADYKEKTTAADIHLTSNGRFLYATNRGHDSVAAYSVDEKSGALTLIDIYKTEPKPRSFVIDHTNEFIYIAGENSGKIAAYSIAENGTLKEMKIYDAAEKLTWIEYCAGAEY